MNCKTLAGIKYVDFISIADLTLYPKKHIRPGKPISIIGNWVEMALVELVSCSSSSERNDAGVVYTSKISGMLTDTDENDAELQNRLQNKFHAYKLTDVYGNEYLVGINTKPFPEITFSPTNESSPAGLRAIPFEITWISTLPPIPIVAL